MTETQITKEIDLLEGKSIQGLFSSKDSDSGFWLLKAKVDLAEVNIKGR